MLRQAVAGHLCIDVAAVPLGAVLLDLLDQVSGVLATGRNDGLRALLVDHQAERLGDLPGIEPAGVVRVGQADAVVVLVDADRVRLGRVLVVGEEQDFTLGGEEGFQHVVGAVPADNLELTRRGVLVLVRHAVFRDAQLVRHS